MYTPEHFAETSVPVLHALIGEFPLAAIVRTTQGRLDADHLPVLVDASRGELGVLRGHVARANPIWKETGAGSEVLAIFQGPSGYVTPSWYPAKREHGKVVPTWNYAVVHARGRIAWKEDAAWLRDLVESLTDARERGREAPWRVSDAPPDYVDRMLQAIVGFEIELTSISGKWKVSQNRDEADRAGVVAGLEREGGEEARLLARLVGRRRAP